MTINESEERSLYEVGARWHHRLNNAHTWRDGTEVEHTIVTMTPEHRANVRRWLRQRVHTIRMAVQLFEITRPGARTVDPWVEPPFDVSDLEWLYQQPLFRALVEAG